LKQINELDLLATAIRDKKFLARFGSRLRSEDFQDEIYGVIWSILSNLWLDYHEMPTYNAVDAVVREKLGAGFFYQEDVPVLVTAMNALRNREVMVNLTYEQAESWHRWRANVKLAVLAQRAVAEDDEELMKTAYREYSASVSTTEDEVDFFDRLVEIGELSVRLQDGFISTGHRDLDNILGGGYLKGDFFMLWGVDGLGKSWLAIQLGMHAITQGRRVLHLTNEMLKQDVEERYLALFSQVNTVNFMDNLMHIRQVQETLQSLRGLLKVQFLPLGSTADNIRAILDEAILDGRPYDFVIIDYVDKIEPGRKLPGDDWLRLEHLFEELAQLSKITEDYKLNPAICAVTHANASADGKAMPTNKKAIGRSRMGKSKAVDFSIVMGQDDKWKEQDIVQITRVKNPRGRGVDAKKITCLLKHLKSTGAFASIGFEEVEQDEE
jgi:hypothetical protein